MGWNVLYVDPPLKFSLLGKTWTAPDRPFHVLSPGRVMPFGVRRVPGEKSGEAWRSRTGAQLAARARDFARELKLTPDAYWFGAPWHSAVQRELPEGPVSVFHVYDELTLSPAFDETQRRLLWQWECELLQACDLTCASSQPQYDRRTKAARRLLLLENVIPDGWLDDDALPQPDNEALAWLEHIRSLPRPLHMYAGVVDHRLDMRCFSAVLQQNPEGSLVFAGHLDDSRDKAFFDEHEGDERVVTTGRLSLEALFLMAREADVLLIGHRRSPFTDAMLPEKLSEYLATGKPVVSIDIPEVCRIAGEADTPDVIRTASTPSEFGAESREAALVDQPELGEVRRNLAAKRTWSAMGKRLDAALRELLRR